MSSKIRQSLRMLSAFKGTHDFDTLIGSMDPDGDASEASRSRAVALVGGAFIENTLRIAITHHLHPNITPLSVTRLFDDDQAPLGDLSARARMAMALGIIDEKQEKDLATIRGIRNAFAHTIDPITFRTREVADALDLLKADPQTDGNLLKVLGPERYGAALFIVLIAQHSAKINTRQPFWRPPFDPLVAALQERLARQHSLVADAADSTGEAQHKV